MPTFPSYGGTILAYRAVGTGPLLVCPAARRARVSISETLAASTPTAHGMAGGPGRNGAAGHSHRSEHGDQSLAG